MKFKDYVSAFDEAKKLGRDIDVRRAYQSNGIDVRDFESLYNAELEPRLKNTPSKSQIVVNVETLRLLAELDWYRNKRPFFNVYPLIENKLLELPGGIDMSELVMPYPAIEVRTEWCTFLLCDMLGDFFFAMEPIGNSSLRHAMVIPRADKIGEVTPEYVHASRHSAEVNAEANARKCLFIAAGMCMLARDPNIIMPVILNKHRKDGMTPAEIAKYADKAIKRTGRVGFEVGRDIERMKATVHYRNGCFAKYYVSKSHESYPVNAIASTVPIIKWRCGSVVNKSNVPRVPTGFKDAEVTNAKP